MSSISLEEYAFENDVFIVPDQLNKSRFMIHDEEKFAIGEIQGDNRLLKKDLLGIYLKERLLKTSTKLLNF